MPTKPYNPLNKLNLGKSVAAALLDSDAHPLGELPSLEGAGIYAIYYRGPHPAYSRLAKINADKFAVPIYLGKAIPSGGRRGLSLFTKPTGKFLAVRLRQHADSIRIVQNLEIEDFFVRWLTVDDIWIPLGETLLISKFQPVWNSVLDGFGNHDPGAGRYNGKIPLWDVLHPGRDWAFKCRRRDETSEELSDRVKRHLESSNLGQDSSMDFDPDQS